MKLGDIFVALGLDTKDYDRGIKDAEQQARSFGSKLNGIFSRITTGALERVGHLITDTFVRSLGAAVRGINSFVTEASDLNEAINRIGVVFGDSAQEVVTWSKTTSDAIGQSSNQALRAAGDFGNLFTALGVGRDEAANMSVELVELASDLASFNNIDPAEALEKLRAGLVGETEPLRTVGVFLNEAVVQAKAAELGFGKVGDKLTEQEKILARYALILDQTSNAQGDFARTSSDLANAQRTLTAQLGDVQTALGQAFLPIKTAFVRGISDIITTIRPFIPNIVRTIAQGLTAAVTLITPALMRLRALFTYWLKPGSPPRLLPELVEWGKAAATEFINGWTKADFSGLQTLGNAIESVLRSFVASGQIDEQDLVSRVLGSREAIAAAIKEFRQVGTISQDTLDNIAAHAGPAGDAIADLVATYFRLQTASEAVRRAQADLNRITDEYADRLDPLTDQLDDVRDAQQKLRDAQRKSELRNVLLNFESTAAERQAARLELQEIALREQIDAEEERKDAALDTAQAQLDAATEAQTAAQEQFDAAQGALQQQVDTNNLLGEQLSLEERLRKEREAAAAQSAAEAEALQQAILQYQLGLTDTQGKIALLRGELSKTQVGSAEYFQILGQIHGLEQQAAEEAARNAEQLAGAQLDYQLQLADTAGKIKILQGELAKAQPGSIEYFNLLTQIAALQQSLADEAGGSLGLLPEIPEAGSALGLLDEFIDPQTKTAIDELTGAIDAMFQSLSGAGSREIGPVTQEDAWSLQGRLIQQSTTEVDNWARNFIADITAIGDALGGITQSFRELNTAFNPDLGPFDNLISLLKTIQTLMSGDWSTDFWQGQEPDAGFFGLFNEGIDWVEWGENTVQGFQDAWQPVFDVFIGALQLIRNLFPSAGGEPADGSSPLAGLKDMGSAILTNLASGVSSAASGVIAGFIAVLQSIRNLLPGSEPADGSSPLANLAAAGEALFNNIWDGLKTKWAEILPWLTTELAKFPQGIIDQGVAVYDAAVAMFQELWDGLQAKWLEVIAWFSGPEGVILGFPAAVIDAGGDLYDAGVAMIDNLWDGLKAKWKEVEAWFSGPASVLQGFVDMLPFSEPKDSSSPLSGLGKAGEAIIANIQAGMDSARLDLAPAMPSLDLAGAGAGDAATTNNNLGGITLNLTINGNADAGVVKSAARNGLIDGLRAVGLRV